MKRKIVTLCGSTRWPEVFAEVNAELTKAGAIVLSVGTFNRKEYHEDTSKSKALKAQLDQLHLDKIQMSDAVVVLNVGFYVGHSTLNELNYALDNGKAIYWYQIGQGAARASWKQLISAISTGEDTAS